MFREARSRVVHDSFVSLVARNLAIFYLEFEAVESPLIC